MERLYDRADIYDLIENEARTEILRNDWKTFLADIPIKTFLDISIGTGGMTLPLQELGIEVFGSDLSEAMLLRCGKRHWRSRSPSTCDAAISGTCPFGTDRSLIAWPAQGILWHMYPMRTC